MGVPVVDGAWWIHDCAKTVMRMLTLSLGQRMAVLATLLLV